jgi:hypothetical protein
MPWTVPVYNLPAVAAVLVACTRDPADAETAAILGAALPRVTDWRALGHAAVSQAMTLLLYRRVSQSCPELVPPAVLATWRERSVVLSRRSLHMQRQLLSLLEQLAAAAVPVAAFKGPVFSQQLYGDSTLRQFVDLDLLVPQAHVAAARQTALDAGFTDVRPLAGIAERTLHSAMQEIVLCYPGTELLVEIHWREGPRFAADSLPAEELVARSVPVTLLGRKIPALSAPDVALVLAVHAATHDWARLEDVAAMASALRNLAPHEAAELEERAASHGCRRRLHMIVLLACAIAGYHPPVAIEALARADRRAGNLAAAAGTLLLRIVAEGAAPQARSPAERMRRELRQARGLDSSAAAARYLWRRLFTPGIKDWSEDQPSNEGPRAAVATFLRRQRRLWRR